MASASDTAQSTGVTIVTQTRVAPDRAAEFESWQRDVSGIVAAQPGFIQQTVLPPSPPGQLDWVIQQRFSNAGDALAWLRSGERERLVAEAQPMLVGRDDVHLLEDSATGVLPAPVSAVISTRIKPGQESAYREWERKIAAAQARAAGFQGYRFEPPVPGVQEDWLTILRFDSETNLQAWLASPERAKLLEESGSFTDEYHTRVVRAGFDQWFRTNSSAPSAPEWKQNMVVLMLLYPVVVLFNSLVQSPLLVQHLGLPLWGALFIGNAVSVVLLSLLVPLASRWLGWWLSPSDRDPKIELGGAALVVGIYALSLLVAWQIS
jgi:antibiotic biosynthesis monooxygenase (ABM) superfamily enzyme